MRVLHGNIEVTENLVVDQDLTVNGNITLHSVPDPILPSNPANKRYVDLENQKQNSKNVIYRRV